MISNNFLYLLLEMKSEYDKTVFQSIHMCLFIIKYNCFFYILYT